MLKGAGYVEFDPKKTYKPGDKVYFVQFKKAVVAATIGTRSFEDGFRLVIAHTDSPRLDLRPTPLYESDHLSYFKTHYYGGVRKYQWGTMPLSIHGVFTRDDGSTVTVRVGEDENDPVFCITDLLPHLGAEQNARTLKDGIKAEELNILIGSDAVEDEEVKEAVKLNTMILLNEKYGITEKEFMRAEIEITPLTRAAMSVSTAPWSAATATMTVWTLTPHWWLRSRPRTRPTPPSASSRIRKRSAPTA